jgi:hypothetical protein
VLGIAQRAIEVDHPIVFTSSTDPLVDRLALLLTL